MLLAAPQRIAREFEATLSAGVAAALVPNKDIRPTQRVLVVRTTADGEREGALLRWGLIPRWARDPSIGNRMINARAETLAEKPSFREALRRRRCLIPADGFYEWKKIGRQKQRYLIRAANDDHLLALAGLWESWQAGDGSELESCTIVTTQPNDLLRPIHDRMPLILTTEQYQRWLDPQTSEAAALRPLLAPYPRDDLVAQRYTDANKGAS